MALEIEVLKQELKTMVELMDRIKESEAASAVAKDELERSHGAAQSELKAAMLRLEALEAEMREVQGELEEATAAKTALEAAMKETLKGTASVQRELQVCLTDAA
eukprot:scaffold682435_cov50-Prasinocladus_malaysianus.AAC.1